MLNEVTIKSEYEKCASKTNHIYKFPYEDLKKQIWKFNIKPLDANFRFDIEASYSNKICFVIKIQSITIKSESINVSMMNISYLY